MNNPQPRLDAAGIGRCCRECLFYKDGHYRILATCLHDKRNTDEMEICLPWLRSYVAAAEEMAAAANTSLLYEGFDIQLRDAIAVYRQAQGETK